MSAIETALVFTMVFPGVVIGAAVISLLAVGWAVRRLAKHFRKTDSEED